MDKNTLLTKTEKGRDAMARRLPELVPRMRSLLILVDGKRTVAELEKLGEGLGGGAALLEQLVANGWVGDPDRTTPFQETVPYVDSQPLTTPVTAPAVAAVSAPAAAPVPAAATLPFPEALRLVVRFINDAVGPMGEQTAMRVESCKSAADLQAQLPRIRDALQNYRGLSMVQRFNDEIVTQLPRG